MKFLDVLQEAVYDIIGFILPGLITIPFIMLVINSNFSYSSIYCLYLDISNFKGLLQSMNLPLTYYIPILIVAYIIGILLKYLSIYFGKLWTSVVKNTPPSTAKSSSDIILSVLKDNSDTLLEKYDLSNNTVGSYIDLKKEFKTRKFLKDYARTMSRFNSTNSNTPNTLTQKYIAKTNFFSSLATFFFIEFLNSIISLIVYVSYNHASHVITVPKIAFSIMLPLIFLGLFCACYKEFKDHNRYQEKENYLYLLETYYKK